MIQLVMERSFVTLHLHKLSIMLFGCFAKMHLKRLHECLAAIVASLSPASLF